ncbi:hypothetical protein ACF0H5_002311 [Mactra antiquata]
MSSKLNHTITSWLFTIVKHLHLPHFRLLIVLVLLLCSAVPYFAINLPFSLLYVKQEKTLELAKEKNWARLEEARLYFKSLDSKKSTAFYQNRYENNLDLIVCIVTMNRHIPKSGYLLQTAAVVDNLIKTDQYFKKSLLLLCNVDRFPPGHSDAVTVERHIPFVQRLGNNSFDQMFFTPGYHSLHSDLRRGQEIGDYIYCLNVSKSFNSSYILMLEDDVVPYKNIFQVLNYTLKQHLLHSSHPESYISQNPRFAFLKLYYPERWLGYANEPDRILELISIGLVGGGLLLLVISVRAFMMNTSLHYCVKLFYFTFGTIATLLTVSLIGRQYIMDLRRISPQLFKFSPTPACCTPAMFYSSDIIPSLIDHLIKNSYMNKDLIINDYIVKNNIPGYILEPNLVRHIGMYTSLKNAYKPPEEFLFDLPIP